MKWPIHSLRTSRPGSSPLLVLWLLASIQPLTGCALLSDPAYEAGWRYGRVLQIGVANTPFQDAVLDCRTQAVPGQTYALVKLGASGAQSRRTIIGPPGLRHAIVPISGGAAIRPNDIVRINIIDCTLSIVRA